ncbi:MAG: NUDIX hydrolase [Oscillospiraceae bacterium]|nr:NUDIX hydrolase [Oscillospiraceae bacterium]
MQLHEQAITQSTAYSGIIVNVRRDTVRLPNGNAAEREVVVHPGGVAILPLDEDGNVTLVKQFRYAGNQVLLEIPAGKLEIGETPEECGRKELREEVGFTAGRFELLSVMYPTMGYCTEKLHLYLARDLTFVSLQPEEDEFLEIVKMPLAKLIDMVVNGEIVDAKTALAAMVTEAWLKDGR